MKMIKVTKSPFEWDNKPPAEPLPWEYPEDGFCTWVWEVFLEGYKDGATAKPSLEEALAKVRELGYEVEEAEEADVRFLVDGGNAPPGTCSVSALVTLEDGELNLIVRLTDEGLVLDRTEGDDVVVTTSIEYSDLVDVLIASSEDGTKSVLEREPVCCPFCKSAEIMIGCVEWDAVSKDDPANTPVLEEHQCRSCARSFWS